MLLNRRLLHLLLYTLLPYDEVVPYAAVGHVALPIPAAVDPKLQDSAVVLIVLLHVGPQDSPHLLQCAATVSQLTVYFDNVRLVMS